MLILAAILAATTPLPPGWEGWGIVGFLLFAVISEAAAIYYLIKWKRDSDRDHNENYVAKQVYLDLKNHCDKEDNRCKDCKYINGDTLRKISESLGEISATQQIEVQGQGSVHRILDTILSSLLKGGN
jgi:hypothetical protein